MAASKKPSAKKAISNALRRVSPEEAQEVLADFQNKIAKKTGAPAATAVMERPPENPDALPGSHESNGTFGGSGYKKVWTLADVRKRFEPVTFTPEETIPITFNGITVYLEAGKEITIYEPFKQIYDNHRKALFRHGSIMAQGTPLNVELGAGALPPE